MRKLYFGILLFLLPIICFGQVRFPFVNSAHYASDYPAVLDDGNTVAWFKDAGSDCTTDGQDSVTVWTDCLNSETITATDGTGACPYLDGDTVKFDGAANYLNGSFTWNDNDINNLYIVIRQDSWTVNERLFGDADGSTGAVFVQQRTGSPQIRMYGSAGATTNETNWSVGDWAMVQTVLTEGENDTLWVNEETPIVAEVTSLSALYGNGIMIGSEDDFGNFGDISVVEIICRKISDTAANREAIYDYLKDKYGF